MSADTKLTIRGLARDPNPFAAASAGALRLAENVVIRSESVAESRPNFDLLRESIGSNRRVRALVEAQDGSVIAVESDVDFLDWSATGPLGDIAAPIDGAFEPPDYETTQTQFMQARGNLYATGIKGPLAIENVSLPARFPGVEMTAVTDWQGTDLTFAQLFIGFDPAKYNDVIPIADQVQSVAYRFVFVKKDSHGYIRRSPPSYDLVTTCIPAINGWGRGTRFYIPYYTTGGSPLPALVEGDQVEFYRTRAVAQGSLRENVDATAPSPFYYLAFIYTITAADAAAGFFAPPIDTTPEAELGAELYTNPSQTGAISAKYAPPLANAMALFQRCAWYGNTASKQRTADIELKNLHRAGVMHNVVRGGPDLAANTVNLDRVVDELYVGMLFTDNFKYGPTVNGQVIAAGTTITKIETIAGPPPYTKLTLSNVNLTGGIPNPPLFGTMDALAPQGLIAEKTGNGTYTSGSKVVTGLTSTAGWRAGMYWTDSPNGPSADGPKVTNQTLIQSVDSSSQITMTQVARASGTVDAFVGDTITIGTLKLYAWIEFFGGAVDLTSNTRLSVWDGRYPYCFAIHDARYGDWARQTAVACICQWVNYYAALLTVKAIPNGWLPTSDFTIPDASVYTTPAKLGDLLFLGPGGTDPFTDRLAPLGHLPYPEGCTGFILEEVGVGGAAVTMSSTCPTAFTPTLDATTTNDRHANRVCFSDLDEPESVPVLNYIDIGTVDAPILALVPLRNALLVFKADGLWRITGSGPSSWSVEQIDTTLRLIRAEAVGVMNGTAYAWCDRGFFAVDENGGESLTANLLDVELRALAALCVGNPLTHGAFVTTWRRRSLVLLGVPFSAGSGGGPQTATRRIYAYCATTNAWSEWPLMWDAACASELDTMYVAESGRYEIRKGVPPRGYDRVFAGLAPTSVSGTTVVVDQSTMGQWTPQEGDYLSAVVGGVEYVRRLPSRDVVGSVWTFVLEQSIPGATTGSTWRAYEGVDIGIEWHPATPARVPTGVLCREIHVQVDLADLNDQTALASIPKYAIGGLSERDTEPQLLVSNAKRLPSVQPLRAGAPRAIARSASIAPAFATSDVFPIRVLGVSLVYVPTSERTVR